LSYQPTIENIGARRRSGSASTSIERQKSS
jgi:hypothetical protein